MNIKEEDNISTAVNFWAILLCGLLFSAANRLSDWAAEKQWRGGCLPITACTHITCTRNG